MTKRMLIDATQPEETRVVVVNGNKLEDVEFESANRKQIKGNIYLGKIMRVEPSLQACFVDYGGNRHGFMAFGELHTDYYNISPEELAEAIQPQFKETKVDTIATIVKRYKDQDTWKGDTIFEEESFDLLQNILEEAGELESRVPYEDLVTTEFAKKAAQ